MTASPVPVRLAHLGLTLRGGTDNNLARINISRLLESRTRWRGRNHAIRDIGNITPPIHQGWR
jgi:hypothetical protein